MKLLVRSVIVLAVLGAATALQALAGEREVLAAQSGESQQAEADQPAGVVKKLAERSDLVVLGEVTAVHDRTATLRWEDKETGRVLFTADDLVRFDWDRQVFELTRERAMDVMAHLWPHGEQYRTFVVRDGAGAIYEGRCYSMDSSLGYDGPTILADRSDPAPPLYAVEGGYPRGGGSRDRDRFSPRLRAALAKAGVLEAIAPDEKAAPIQRDSTGWHSQDNGPQVRAEIFPETFRIGQAARVHVFFAPRKADAPTFDTVEIGTSLTQNQMGFFCTSSHAVPQESAPDIFKTGLHVLRWMPWGPVYGAREALAKPGPAELSLKVVLRKKTPRGMEAVYTVDIPARRIMVLPAEGAVREPGAETPPPPAPAAPALIQALSDPSEAKRAEAAVAKVADGCNRFAFDLYAKLKDQEGNLFLSPYSISTALTMTYAGARGTTAEQMDDVLCMPGAPEEAPGGPPYLHAAFAALQNNLNTGGKEGAYELAVANRLWGQKGYGFLPDFLGLLKTHYGAGIEEVDFVGDTEAARQTINGWVEEQTKDKIKELLKRGILTPQKVMVVLPKFKTTAEFELKEPLIALGMGDAFNPGKADFSGMNGRKDLFISAVVHKAFVDVSEEGTEAAAATGIVMTLTALPEPPPIFRADHPFLHLIRDQRTGAILFLGRLTDPTR